MLRNLSKRLSGRSRSQAIAIALFSPLSCMAMVAAIWAENKGYTVLGFVALFVLLVAVLGPASYARAKFNEAMRQEDVEHERKQ